MKWTIKKLECKFMLVDMAQAIVFILLLPIAIPYTIINRVCDWMKDRKVNKPKDIMNCILKYGVKYKLFDQKVNYILIREFNGMFYYGINYEIMCPNDSVWIKLNLKQHEEMMRWYCPKGAERVDFHSWQWYKDHDYEDPSLEVKSHYYHLKNLTKSLDDYVYHDERIMNDSMGKDNHILFMFKK